MALSDSCNFEQLRETVADELDIFPNPGALSAGDSVMILVKIVANVSFVNTFQSNVA